MNSISRSSQSPDLFLQMREFILDQATGRTADTVNRYEKVADALAAFLAEVDVEPWLGPQIHEYFSGQRRTLGDDAFLTVLGLTSLIRVFPAFVADPWLPPPGAQRRTHRAVARSLIKFIRVKAVEQGCFHSGDFRILDRALGRAYQLDYADPTRWNDTVHIVCTVNISLPERVVDALLDAVTRGSYATFDDAVSACLNDDEDRFGQRGPRGW